jgi:hypothetical protein
MCCSSTVLSADACCIPIFAFSDILVMSWRGRTRGRTPWMS